MLFNNKFNKHNGSFVAYSIFINLLLKKKLMKIFAITISLVMGLMNAAEAQYYFKDIISTNEATKTLNAYKLNKINKVSVVMLDNYGEPLKDFKLEKKVDKKYGKTELVTKTEQSPISYMKTIHDAEGKTLYSTDSSENSVIKTIYQYNNKQQVSAIDTKIYSADDDFITEIDELHKFEYDEKGMLQKMYRIQNNRDTTVILFALDEKGNVSVEKNTNTGTKFYYYYDDNNRLTDVVQSSLGRTGLYPDYIFTYNKLGDITQMITTGEANGEYVTWKYTYDNGLRATEKLYGKDKKLIGTMEYLYK